MTAPANTAASVICTLCGAAGLVETDMTKPEGPATAALWAAHFAMGHPEVTFGANISSYLVIAPEPEPEA